MSNQFDETRLYDSLNCLVIQLDGAMDICFVNRFGLDFLGYENIGQLFGKPFRTLLPDNEQENSELLQVIDHLNQRVPSSPIESDLRGRSGSITPILWSLNHLNAKQRALTLLLGFDARSSRETQTTARLFQSIAEFYAGSIVITNPERVIVYANPAFLHLTGYALNEVLGRTPVFLQSGQTSDDVYRNLWESLEMYGSWNGEFINRRKDGTDYIETKTISVIRDTEGQVQYYFAIGEDISLRQRYQQHIDHLRTFDQLTGLPNRASFLDLFSEALNRAREEKRELTVLHVDIDDFFAVNESVGIRAADKLIVRVGECLQEVLRQDDILARLGNDKFAILLGPHEAGIDNDILEVTERVRASIGDARAESEKPTRLTASIGIASYPVDGDTASELLSHAMSATERIKASGGDNFCRFEATTTSGSSSTPRLLPGELRQAVKCNQMVLHFQPQISLFSGAIVGMEALIRWQHPQHGLLSPAEFLPLAEPSYLIVEIGEWVLYETCRQMREWLNVGLPPVKIAINLAARHFLVPNLHVTIADALKQHSIEPRFLEIEITEGAMMQDVSAAIRSTRNLKEIGVRISLDDFGTGYSSLAYLSRFPIDVVKIDQSFVRDITTNPVNATIAQATIAMSHKLNKVVLAEGVETEEQMQYLRRNECDEMQGYFFSKPLPAEDISRMLQEREAMNLSGEHDTAAHSTVLFVDDESNILASLKRTLRREGYIILTANSTAEGFSLLAKNPVQLVVSDQRMPEMNGTEFLSRVKSLYPQTVRMVLSGYSEISAVTDAINKGAVYRFMLKPWDDETLREEILGALRHWRELYGAMSDEHRVLPPAK